MHPSTAVRPKKGSARPAILTLALILILIISLPGKHASAQTDDPPKLVVDFRGPVGKTRALGFAGSARRFYSAGENKRIQFYDIANGAVIPGSVIRWEFSRGALGEVNDAAASSDGRKILFGGSSLRNNGGDLLLVDAGSQQVITHFSAPAEIISVALSPSGQTVVAGDICSGVTTWSNSNNTWQQQVLRPALPQASADTLWNPLAIVDDSTVHYIAQDADTSATGLLATSNLQSGELTLGTTSVPLPVCTLTTTQIAQQPGCLTASVDGTILFHGTAKNMDSQRWSASDLLVNRLRETSLTVAALSPDSSLLAIAGDGLTPADDSQVMSFVALLDFPAMTIIDMVEFPGEACCESLAFSPNSAALLACNDEAETLLLWTLRDADGKTLNRPLASASGQAAGRGRSFQTARFVQDSAAKPDGYRLQLQDLQSQIWQLEPGTGELELQQPADLSTVIVNSPDTFAPGWTVTAEPVSEDGLTQTVLIVAPPGDSTAVQPIRLNVVDQGQFSGAFTFLRGAGDRPFAIALGTTLIDGIFLYRIPPTADVAPQLIRYFRDHAGQIRDLSVSTDQRFLASCSADQTVKIWSLSGIDLDSPRSIWGGRIELQPDGSAGVSELNPAGILYARGLRDGDSIAAVRTALQPELLQQNPRQITDLLSSHPAWATLDLWLTRTGFDANNPETGARRINPGWEPLLTLVADKSGEWVLFTPEGWFDASVASGDRLFGWQINRGVALPPRFEPAEHLQKEYEKPEVIRQVLQTGSVSEALAALNRPVVGDLRLELRNRVLALPDIRIISPADGFEAQAPAPVPVTAEIRFAQPDDAGDFEFLAAQNGRSLLEQNRSTVNGILTVTWISQTLEPANLFSVTAREPGNDLVSSDQSKASVTVLTSARKANSQARVFLLGLAVDAYQKVQPLQFSIQSVSAFRDDLQLLAGREAGKVPVSKLLADAQVSTEAIDGGLAEFLALRRKQSSPDDLIVVVVSGQGVSRTVARGSSIRLNALEEFFFLPPQVDPKDLRQLGREGIRWKNLCDPVNQSDCDVLWIVDASHSRRARNEAKAAFSECRGPHGRHVIFTDQTEAVESALWQVRSGEPGNSSLLTAVREALLGRSQSADADKAVAKLWQDQKLSFDDLAEWTADRAQRLADSVGKRQKVLYSPTAPASAVHPLILGSRTGQPAVSQ
jgi:WD40 repeat protein